MPDNLFRDAVLPSWHELRARHLRRRKRTRRAVHRLALEGLFALSVVRLAAQCLFLAVEVRRDRRRLEIHRSQPGGGDMLVQDLRFAARILWKKRAFTVMAVAALATGIGANTAMFSIVRAVLLRPLPYGDSDRIVRIHETARGSTTSVSPPNFVDWRSHNRTLERVAGYDDVRVTIGGGAEPERVDALLAGVELFDVLGVRVVRGRAFTAADEHAGAAKVVILGYDIWQRRFGGDPDVLGRTLTIDSEQVQVIGIMPEGMTFTDGVGLWLPLRLTDDDLRPSQQGAHYVRVVGRLKPGVTVAQAQTDIAAIEQQIASQFVQVQGYGIWVQPIMDSVVGDYRRPLWMLLGAVAFVLAIGCANISNLLLVRAATRRSEIAVRSALGASRWRIIRQLLAESVLLSFLSGVAGIALAVWGLNALDGLLPADLPRAEDLSLHWPVLLFTLVTSLVTGLVFGLVPAVQSSAIDLVQSLKEGGRDGFSASGRRSRSALVAVEVALAMVLLAGAGLAIRSFDRLTAVNPGFDPSNVLSLDLIVPPARYADGPSVVRFFRDYLNGLSSQQGVVSAGAVMLPPLARSGYGGTFNIIGREPADDMNMQVRAVTPGYLETLRIPRIRGRLIERADNETGPNVAVISEEAARRFWPGQDPVGQRIRIHVGSYEPEREREIVGVAGDVKVRTLEGSLRPVVYVPHAQYPADSMTVFVRSAGNPMSLAPMVRARLTALDPEVAVSALRPAETLLSSSVAQPRFRMVLLTLFASVALTLAAVGLYGVMAFSVTQRAAEIGLRVALGAERGDVLALVFRQAMVPVCAGLVAGLTAALWLTRLMRGMLYNVEPFDPVTFAMVSILLAVVAAAACYVPARRAARVDPVVALRAS